MQSVNDVGDAGNFRDQGPSRKMLVLETAYTLEAVRQRRLERSITCRDLDGFFDHVWSVHPFATLLTSDAWGPRFGLPEVHELAPRHTVIQGKVGRFARLRRIFLLNFLLSQISLFRFLRKLIGEQQIDLIRTASPLYLGLLGLALSRTTRIPLVIRIGSNNDLNHLATGLPTEPRLMRYRWVEKIVERFVFPRADLVAGANQNNLDFALANGARRERTTLFRYGNLIDTGHLGDPSTKPLDQELLERLGIGDSKFLLNVGRLDAVKRHDDLINALGEIRRRGHDVKLLIAGDGNLRLTLERQAQALGVADSVIFAGNLDQVVLSKLYRAAAVVLSPFTGRALTEAGMNAAPVVAYDFDWQREVVETGETGVLLPFGDWRGMADAAVRLLDHPNEARRLGQELRERMMDMLDPVKLDEHERSEYRKIIARHPGAARHSRRVSTLPPRRGRWRGGDLPTSQSDLP